MACWHRLFVAAGTSLAAAGVLAQVNRCVLRDGTVTFSDKACAPTQARASDPLTTRREQPQDVAARQRREVIQRWESDLPAAIAERERLQAQSAAMQARERERVVAATVTRAEPMPFETCRAQVQVRILMSNPAQVRNLVVSPQVTMTRFCSAVGSELVTCSQLDARKVTVSSPDTTAC